MTLWWIIGIIPSAGSTAAFSIICAYSIASATMTMAASVAVMGIMFIKRVSPHAVGFRCIAAPKRVNYWWDGLKMSRINAVTSSAKVVDNTAIGQSPNKNLINNSVNLRRFVTFQGQPAVSLFISKCNPQPARTAVIGYSWINSDLRKDSGKQSSIGGKFVRIIGEHLRLLFSLNGLGFRGLTYREALSF